MSKNKKVLLILLISVLVLAIAFTVILLTAPEDEIGSDTEDKPVYMYELKSDEFVKAEVQNELGGFTIYKTSDGYTIDGLTDYKLDTYVTGWVGDKLISPNAGRTVSDASDDLSEYGLDNPSVICTVYKSTGDTIKLCVGSDAPGGGVYFKTDLDNMIYIITNNLPIYLKKSADSFVSPDIIPSGREYGENPEFDTSIKYVYIGGKAREEEIEISFDESYDADSANKTETPYKMTLPIHYNINSSTSGDLLQYCAGMTFTDCITTNTTAESLAKYGLDNPDYILIYKFADKTNKILFSISDEYYYAMLDGYNAIFTAYPTYTSFLSEPADTYMSRITFGEPLTSLSKLKVNCQGKEWVFKVDHTEDSIIPYYGSLQIDEQNFKQYFENLIMTLSEGRAKNIPENADPYMTITYSFNNGKDDIVASFIPAEGTKYIYQLNGEGIFYILKSQVDCILQDTEKLSKNETIKTTI